MYTSAGKSLERLPSCIDRFDTDDSTMTRRRLLTTVTTTVLGTAASDTALAAKKGRQLVAEPFESPEYVATFTDIVEQGRYDSLTTDTVASGDSALAVTFPRGNQDGMVAKYDPAKAGDTAKPPKELFASYDVYFPSGFQGHQAALKLPGPANTEGGRGHGGKPSRGRDWSARSSFSQSSSTAINLGYYVYHLDMDGKYGDRFPSDFVSVQKGQWHHIDQYVRLNTVNGDAVADGVLQLWIDGTKHVDNTQMRWTNQPQHGINYNWTVWYGGDEPSPKAQRVYFDNWQLHTGKRHKS